MIGILQIASYIYDCYSAEYRQEIDEMKLQKLLYFAQRECIIQFGKPLFAENMQAWRLGPVSPLVRQAYRDHELTEHLTETQEAYYKPVFDYIFAEYAPRQSMTLSDISHSQLSWKRARKGLTPFDKTNKEMALSDIYEDAENAKKRRKAIEQFKILQSL